MRVRLKTDRLLELIARSSLSQNHWAIKLGLSKGHWSAIVNGKHPFPSPRTRERMLEIFQVDFEDLFETEAGPTEGMDAEFQTALAEKYLIEKAIGQGGMGTVFLARDIKHNRYVAIKVISPEAVSGIGVKRFLTETRFAARLQHHHILPVYDSGAVGDAPYYVTPYIERGSLSSLITKHIQMSVSDVVTVIDGITQALDYAHGKHILHCDIKPANILISGDERHGNIHPYVADFGISRTVHAEVFEWGRRGELDSSAGTPAYVSPEQATGEHNLKPTSDIYSLGCMAFEMLTGTPPFVGTTTMETVSQRFAMEPPDVRAKAPHVPKQVAKAVQTAMALNPEDRFQKAHEFAEELERGASESGGVAVTTIARQFARTSALTRRMVGHRILTRSHKFMNQFAQDVRFAFRSLKKRPMFAFIVLTTLALGIGMNTAIFSVLHGTLFRPLPFPEGERLVQIGRTQPITLPGVLLPISIGDFVELKPQIRSLEAFEAYSNNTFIVGSDNNAARVTAGVVTPGFFDLLKKAPTLGRTFLPSDGESGGEKVVVIGHAFWRDFLASNPNAVGTTVTLSDVPYTVVGVMGEEFEWANRAVWTTYQWTPEERSARNNNFLRLYGKMPPNSDPNAISSDLERLWRIQGEKYPDNYDESGMRIELLQDVIVERSKATLYLLTGAVGFVLLIACANVANLMLVRAESRQREIAVRSALGAGRNRIAGQFLTESLVVAITGGFLGIGVAYAGVKGIIGAFGSTVPRANEIGINGVVLLFSVVIAVGTGLLIGLVPAIQAKPNHQTLKDGARGSSSRITYLRKGLVIIESALAVMLVVGAGLLIKSFWNAQNTEMGFDKSHLLVANVFLPPSRFGETAQEDQFFQTLIGRLEQHPTVEDVAMSSLVPVRSFGSNYTRVEVFGDPENFASFVETRRVTPSYFETLKVPLLQGRFPSLADTVSANLGIVINETLSRTLFPEGDALGKRLGLSTDGATIVGIVGDVKNFGPDRERRPTIYWPRPSSTNLIVRTTGDPLAFAGQLRSMVSDIDRNVSVYQLDTLEEIIFRSLTGRRFQLILLGLFATVALALGAIGIYGVMSYTVERQTQELGVRLALGAEGKDILKLVLIRGGTLALVGVGIGLVGAGALSRVVENMLYEVSGTDPLIYGSVAAILTLVAGIACWFPAWKASRVDPLEAIRYE
ncbi:MAG: ADOP family duplicated permease [Gemmatimonadota bacterium]|nr:ADOP family duplicated permease [Gemmatimonadota bacterium]